MYLLPLQREHFLGGHENCSGWEWSERENQNKKKRRKKRRERCEAGFNFQPKICLLTLMRGEEKMDEGERGGEKEIKPLGERWEEKGEMRGCKTEENLCTIPVIKTKINPSTLFYITLYTFLIPPQFFNPPSCPLCAFQDKKTTTDVYQSSCKNTSHSQSHKHTQH